MIQGLRAYEIKKLDPAELSTNQLMTAYRRATHFGQLDTALDMLLGLSNREDSTFPWDPGHFADLMESALSRGNLDIARRARELVPADCDYVDWERVDMRFALCTDPGLVEKIEERCRQAFCAPVGEFGFRDHGFCDLAHTFHHGFPALSILFARAAIQECPDRPSLPPAVAVVPRSEPDRLGPHSP